VGWATRYIEELQRGTTVQFRPRGNSMVGKIDSGQLVTVRPTGELELKLGTIVLCKVGKAQYLHLIKRFVVSSTRLATIEAESTVG